MKNILVLLFFISISYNSFSQIPPSPPTNVLASQINLDNSIKVDWTAPSSPTLAGYKLFYKKSLDVTYTPIRLGLVTTANLNGLSFNDTYSIFLRSFRLGTLPTDTIYSTSDSEIKTVFVVNLIAPSISINSNDNTPTSLGVNITDANISETGFQIELNYQDIITTKDINASTSSLFIPVDGLAPKTTYSVRARAKKDNLYGPWSSSIYGTTKIDLPPSPNIFSTQNCPEKIQLEWTIPSRSEDIESFIIQKSFDNSFFNTLANLPSNTRNFTDYSSLPGRNQFYRIYAVNSTGVRQSNVTSVVAKDYVAPNQAINPISDINSKRNYQLKFLWTNGSEDLECKTNIRSQYLIKIKINNEGDFTEYARIPSYQPNILIPNLKPKTIVELGIIAISDKGILSSMVTIKDTSAGPPYPPSNTIGVLYYDAIGVPVLEVSYKDNSKDEDYFIIERSTDNKNFTQLGKIKFDLTKFKDANLEEGVLYYYRVKAGSSSEGDSEYTPVIGPFIAQYSKAPNAPYGLKAKQNGAKVNLTWYDDSIREENYIIEKSLDEGVTYSLVATLGRNVTAYTDENVTGGKSYIYRAKAVNTVGTSGNSNLETIKISATGLIEDKLNANVYPNPAFESLNIETANLKVDKEVTLKVYDRNNRQVLTKIFKSNGTDLFELPISNLGQGMYNVVITDGETSISKKVFKY